MKKILLGLACILTFAAQAQNEKYVGAMKKSLTAMGDAKTVADFQAVSAAFERIAEAEKTQWLPYYYAGLALTNAGWADPKLDADKNAEKVIPFCEKAEALTTEAVAKSEILTIRNMITMQQMLIDPQGRFMKYGQQAGKYLEQAIQLNPENPRTYYLQGANFFGTPEQFGGGKAVAKPLLEKSVELYKKAETKPLYPDWGKTMAEEMLAKCI